MGSINKLVFLVMLIVMSAVACQVATQPVAQQQATTAPTADAEVAPAEHPEDMGNKDCAVCHMEITPWLYAQWEQSAHGFTGVKCQVCHGDQDNFVAAPANEKCEGCHTKQLENNLKPEAKCSSCHLVHNFTVHKVQDYK